MASALAEARSAFVAEAWAPAARRKAWGTAPDGLGRQPVIHTAPYELLIVLDQLVCERRNAFRAAPAARQAAQSGPRRRSSRGLRAPAGPQRCARPRPASRKATRRLWVPHHRLRHRPRRRQRSRRAGRATTTTTTMTTTGRPSPLLCSHPRRRTRSPCARSPCARCRQRSSRREVMLGEEGRRKSLLRHNNPPTLEIYTQEALTGALARAELGSDKRASETFSLSLSLHP